MSKRSTAIGRRFQDEKWALAVISECDDILLLLEMLSGPVFTPMRKYKGGSEHGNCRLNHESANTAGDKFFG